MRVRLVGSIFVLSSLLAVGCGGGDDDDDDVIIDYDAAVTPQPDSAVPLPDADTTDAVPTPDADTTDAAPLPDADTTDAAPLPDAGPTPDAPVGCAPTGDYVEAADATNNLFETGSASEASGQSFDPMAPTAFTIGGCIDPAYETADVADADFYDINIANDGMVRVEVENFGAPSALTVVIWATDGTPLAVGSVTDSGVAVHGQALPAGDYWLSVYQELPSPTGAYTYRVTVTQYPYADCVTLGGAADYTEANDGAGNRDNDMAEVVYSPSFAITPTASTTDVPEPTGVTAAAGADYKLAGTTASVASPGDEYLDRDTFAFATGPGVSEVFIRLNWPDVDVDMDMLLFPMDGLDALVAGATFISTSADETIITGVAPDSTYWVWAGTYDDAPTMLPQDYSITICAH